ncbi:MAG: SDR family NAD(P)-dependent oxidoreductase, partial [Alphaproteobacteria bacterium]
MDLGLTDKVVLITGAASGLGRATALAFAKAGSRLVLGDIQEELLATVAAECWNVGATVTPIRLDLTDTESCAQFVQSAGKEHGRIDALVNVAGAIVMNPIEKVTLADWDRVYAVNVRGPFFMIQAALPFLLE